MEASKLKEILEKHKMWLNGEEGGEKANLKETDLRRVDLRGTNLRVADLREADLRGANLIGADLIDANLRGADLICADLSEADLRRANLSEADLSEADLYMADLREADLRIADLSATDLRGTDLRRANLSGADLSGADLRGADLSGTNLDYVSYPLYCNGLCIHIDDRIGIQLLYHAISNILFSHNTSETLKEQVSALVDTANKFHRVDECGELKPFVKEATNNE